MTKSKKIIKIESVAEYVDFVCRMNSEYKKENQNSDSLLFRGQPDEENKLIPSLGRCMGEKGKVIIEEERNMIEMAKYKLPNLFQSNMKPIELLALLQHHGIPTRLLDVSENALVGLYFACHDNEKTRGKDGEVIVFKNNDYDVTNYPVVNAIADTYRFVNCPKVSLGEFYQKASCQEYFSEVGTVNDNIRDDAKKGARWIEDCCRNVLFVYAPSYSLRQNIQRGRYILFANNIIENKDGDKCFERKINEIPKEHEAVVARIIVPADVKASIRRDLRLLGVSKELLFLDNADMVCREIADRFGD